LVRRASEPVSSPLIKERIPVGDGRVEEGMMVQLSCHFATVRLNAWFSTKLMGLTHGIAAQCEQLRAKLNFWNEKRRRQSHLIHIAQIGVLDRKAVQIADYIQTANAREYNFVVAAFVHLMMVGFK